MNLSVGFVLGSLLFLTPALVLIIALRIYYPINRTLSFMKEGLVLPAAALFISAAVNGPLFLDYVSWSLNTVPELWQPLNIKAVTLLGGVSQGWVHRPGTWFLRKVLCVSIPDHNVLGLVLDVHVRVLFLSGTLIVLVRLIGTIGQRVEARWYRHKAASANASKFIAEQSERSWYNPLRGLQYIREAIYHPWALMTSYNPHREALMIDVLTKQDNLYSGMFTSWMPQGDEAASTLSMQYILRHYPRDPVPSTSSDARYTDFPATATADARPRKVKFIERNGEILFPWSEVASVHFWELRCGTETIVTVRKSKDLEFAKWWLALHEVNPQKITKFVIEFQDGGQLKAELLAWTTERKLSLTNVETIDRQAEVLDPDAPTAVLSGP